MIKGDAIVRNDGITSFINNHLLLFSAFIPVGIKTTDTLPSENKVCFIQLLLPEKPPLIIFSY